MLLSREIAKDYLSNPGRTIPYHGSCYTHTEYEVLFKIRVEQRKITFHCLSFDSLISLNSASINLSTIKGGRLLCPRLFALLADVPVRLPNKQLADLTGISSGLYVLSEALKIGRVRGNIRCLVEDSPVMCPCPGGMEVFSIEGAIKGYLKQGTVIHPECLSLYSPWLSPLYP